MTASRLLAGVLLATLATPLAQVYSQEFEPLAPLDTAGIDQDLLKSMYGPWVIVDKSDTRRCKVVLKEGQTIGGSEIEVDPGCAKLFPIMGEITAWRLMQGWGIDLVDATRKTRIRFTTPDDAYVAEPEVDGIFSIRQPEAE